MYQPQTVHRGTAPADALPAERAPRLIGHPIHFASGPFAGRTIRAALDEIQQAQLGRKYARVDRRPLDPPPAVRLRLFEVYDLGTDREMEAEFGEYGDVLGLGFVCTLDLFPLPEGRSPGPYGEPPVHRVGGCAIYESEKATNALVGSTFVQPTCVTFEGRQTLVFVFSDLAVKHEGDFLLRYRVFDLFSLPRGHRDLAMQAECYGGVFHIYTTKDFPGLQPSTDLTKQFAKVGVRLNVRDSGKRGGGATKRRKRSDSYEDDDSS
ncbi:velvet factor-domain-containing protein [Schizophyllum amplum]|uniref:Velvet factor-domain-containing protein n=1 Tax=Schizophyllum amplum TaxID=97359 RepID=A0A550CQ79_9AGAR|nr:velvet factor-domain-containing protein [Auriculariopsis ampla]